MAHPGASIPGVADCSERGLTAFAISPRSAARRAVVLTLTPERVALTLGTGSGVGGTYVSRGSAAATNDPSAMSALRFSRGTP